MHGQKLALEEIPLPDADWDEIGAFALTFDGYEHHGSFDKCADIANGRQHDTLVDLRTCLFFEQRRWRHFGDGPTGDALEYIRELVRSIRNKVAED